MQCLLLQTRPLLEKRNLICFTWIKSQAESLSWHLQLALQPWEMHSQAWRCRWLVLRFRHFLGREEDLQRILSQLIILTTFLLTQDSEISGQVWRQPIMPKLLRSCSSISNKHFLPTNILNRWWQQPMASQAWEECRSHCQRPVMESKETRSRMKTTRTSTSLRRPSLPLGQVHQTHLQFLRMVSPTKRSTGVSKNWSHV